MENLREDFILDNQPGDIITVMLQNGAEWTGKVIDWNERRVRLEMDGVPRTISFNIIDAYYPAAPAAVQPAPAFVPAPAPAPAVKPVPAATPAQLAVARVNAAEYRIVFDPDLIREQLRLAPNTMEKERISALFQSFLRADAEKSDPLALKRVTAAADKLAEQYPDRPLTQRVIGEMALYTANWESAEECFYAAQSYARAFFAASQLNNEEQMAEDGACHLLYEKKKEADVVYAYLRMAAKAEDLSVFRRFLNTEGDLYPELAADSLCWLLQNRGLPLPEGENITEPTVIDAMTELFDRHYPDRTDCQLKKLEPDEADEEQADSADKAEETKPLPIGLQGYFYDYSSDRRFGRIFSPERSDWFFHYNHITDPLLQGMLDTLPDRRYLVTFDVGTNDRGLCATNIHLTDPAHPFDDTRRSGTITSFYPYYQNGKIACGEELYNFRVDKISDPDLRSYCTVSTDVATRKFEVTFLLYKDREGKDVAIDVRLTEPFSESEQKTIREQMEAEQNRTGVIGRYFPTQQRGMVQDGASDFFFELEDVSDPDLRRCLETLPDPAARRFRVLFAVTRRSGRSYAENIRLNEKLSDEDNEALNSKQESKPEVDNPFLRLPPWPDGESREGRYLQAQQERLKGDPAKAVNFYLDAIRSQDRLESSVSDLVSLFLQLHQDENAILLMKAFERILPEEKAINNWISIYDRTKSDDPLLLSFYDRILNTPLKVNTKLHYLVKKAQLLTRMEQYENSMAAYAQWEALAMQAERGFVGSSGWEQVAISDGLRNLIARGRAICLYHMGHKNEAREIAARLAAQNPSDTAAQQILSDQLEKSSTDASLGEQAQDLPVSAYENLSSYVRELLGKLSIQSVVRIKSIEDDKFTGNIQQAARDLDAFEKSAGGLAPKARSDRRLAAAKLILRCLQKSGSAAFQEKGLSKFSENYFETMLGSGMCSFGDAQLQEGRPAQAIRYSYLQAVPLLQHGTTRTHDQDLINAVCRYIATYFLSGDRLRDITARPEEIERCTRLFSDHECNDVSGFVRGLFFLLDNGNPHRDTILHALYHSPLQEDVTPLLRGIALLPDFLVESENDFLSLWSQASDQWLKNYRAFCSCFSTGRLDFLSSARIDSLKNSIAQEQAAMLPDESDKQTLSEFLRVLILFERFASLSEFDLREQALRSIGDLCQSLSSRIEGVSTAFSYETLLGAVNLAFQTALRQLEKIYDESRPSLSLTARGAVSPTADGRFTLPLFIENGPNLQTADNLRVSVECDEGVQFLQLDGLKGHVKGGSEEGFIAFFSSADSSLNAFTVTVTVTYEYRESGKTRTGERKETFPVSVSDSAAVPIKNPFRAHASQQEVEDPNMFFGREKDIADIISIISDGSGQLTPKKSVALYGQKRTGKSSLLYHVRRRIQKDFPQAVLLDLGSLGTYDTANNNFTKAVMESILSKLRRAILLDKCYTGLKQLMAENDLTIPYQEFKASENGYDIIFNDFMDHLDWIIEKSEVPYRFIIFMDEFTHLYGHIQQGTVTAQFLRFWRESIHDHRWISIIVGQDSMETLKRQYSNELGATAMFPVTYLRPDDARKMIQVPIARENPEVTFDEKALDRLVELTAGSAYLLMILCAELVDHLNELHHNHVMVAHIEQLVTRVFASGIITGSNFDPLYNDVSCPGDDRRKEDNFTLLTELARCTRLAPAVSLGQLNPEGLSAERVAELLRALEARGVVKVEQNQYSIVVGLFKEWLNNRYGEAL